MVTYGINWVAIVGIIGTLAGVCVGAFVTWKIQERQFKHSDATRFQKDRLDTYAQYTGAANLAVSYWIVNQQNPDATEKFIDLFERVRLVATDEVMKHANLLHEKFGEIQRLGSETKIPEKNLLEFNLIVGNFVNAARNELRIRENNS